MQEMSKHKINLQHGVSSPHARNNGGGGDVGRSASETADTKVKFTLMYDQEVRYLTISKNENIAAVKQFVLQEFNIRPHCQLLYGWPGGTDPGSSEAKLKDLRLPSEVGLFVATTDDPEPNGPVAGTSKNDDGRFNVTIELNIFDALNEEPYDLPFSSLQTVGEVKSSVGEITGIQPNVQVWSGWPENTNDKKMLKDLKLDKPFHSLVVMLEQTENPSTTTTAQRQPSPTNVGPVANGVKKSTEKSKAQPESSNATPIYRARKSCTKGAAEDLKKRRERNGFTGTSHSSRSRESKNSNVTPSCSTAGNSARVDQSDSDVGGLLSDSESSRLVTPRRSQKNLLETLDDDFPPSTPKKAKIDCSQRSPPKSPKKLCPSLLALPKKLSEKILQYLNPLEQLSLRRVCKATNKWVTRDQKEISPFEEEKWRNYQLTITGVGLKTFKTATKMGLPITRYTFDVEGEYFYLDEFMDNFLIQFGLLVKDLTLLQFFMFQNQNEYKMFQSLHNLEKLVLNNLIENDASTSAAPNPCPSTLRDLQVLKLNYKINVPQDNVLIRPKSWDLTWSMLHDCQSLLYFRFPKIEFPIGMTSGRVGIFAPLMDYIEMRVRLGKVSIEYLDLKHFTDSDSLYINRYMELLRKCHRKDIKLKNVNAQVVQQVFDEDEGLNDKKLEFCENIVSLINYRPFVENAPLRNLEKLIIDVVPSSAEYETLGRDYKNIFWPNLRTIKIKDTFQQRTVDIQNGWQIIQEDLYGLNASGLDRTSVKCIVIDSPRFPYFLSEGRLAQKFYNVTKLKLSSWCRDDKMSTLNKRLVAIWKKLKLVELHIENCPKLNDNSFIEEIEDEDDEDDYFERPPPAFLKLAPTLKKLTLDLDETKLTDRCFIDVFSQMKLQAFVLLSKQPVDISERALLKLLNGEFGKHIERFPFDGWSTSRISSDRFMRLGRKFRSMF